MGGAWKVHGRCAEGVREVRRRCAGGAQEVCGRCAEGNHYLSLVTIGCP